MTDKDGSGGQGERDPRLVALGARVRELRERAGLTQVELARTAGMGSRPFLAGVEAGKRNIGLLMLCDIASALDCHVSDLVADLPILGSPARNE